MWLSKGISALRITLLIRMSAMRLPTGRSLRPEQMTEMGPIADWQLIDAKPMKQPFGRQSCIGPRGSDTQPVQFMTNGNSKCGLAICA